MVGGGGIPSVVMKKSHFEAELAPQQVEMVKMMEWIRHTGHRLVVLFEGRDAAGKGGTIKRIVEPWPG
ncbi:MAG: hypothetical protein H0T70_08375 [Acidimicrobiia bacterium]|nr:hypothetical protein [Acidimicrobiia bacterium]